MLIREFVFSTDDCIIISGQLNPQEQGKDYLHILNNQASKGFRGKG